MRKLIAGVILGVAGFFAGVVYGLVEDRCETCGNERVVLRAPASGNVEVHRCPDCRDGELLAVTTMPADRAGEVPPVSLG